MKVEVDTHVEDKGMKTIGLAMIGMGKIMKE